MKTPQNCVRGSGLAGSLGASALATALGLSATGAIAQDNAASESRYSLTLEEVLVTAQKREEGSMSVPISVDAFTVQDMINTGATDIGDIDSFMPGVEISARQSTQTGVSIRGVRSPGVSTGQDPSIATFYDGAYLPRAATTIPLIDAARVEVLKGPQGTLFGRNASVGVINIVPNKPSDELEAKVKTRLGNHDLLRLEGMVNVPVSDQLALRANLFHHQRDGMIENKGIGDDLEEQNFTFARAAALFHLSDATTIQLAGDYEDRDEATEYSVGVSKYAYSTDPFEGATTNDVVDRGETREMYGVSLQVEHDFNDALSMFAITSYRDWETWNLQDEDGTSDPRRYFDSNNIEDSDIWYNEVRFNFIDGPLNLIVGGNYSQEEVYQNTTISLLADSYMSFVSADPDAMALLGSGPDNHLWDLLGADGPYLVLSEAIGVAFLPPTFAGTMITENMENTGEFVNWGIFADATYDLTDTVRVAGGLRYSYDEKEYTWQTLPSTLMWPVPTPFLNFEPPQTGAPEDQYYDKFEDKEDWSKVTGRLVVDWQFSDDAMTYLSYATGYKSGGWDGNQFSSVSSGPFDPEEMTSIELGLKGDFFDSRLRVEAAIFHHELDGKQNQKTTKSSPDDPTAAPTIVTSDEEADGFEVVVRWSVMDDLLLTALTTIRESEQIEERYFDGKGEPRGGIKEDAETDTDYTLRLDWTPEIPRGFLLVHVDYVFEEAGDDSNATIYTTGPWYYQDKKLLNARIAWSNDADSVEVALWGSNLLDEEYATNPGGFVADTLGAYKTSLDDTITYGVDLRYTF